MSQDPWKRRREAEMKPGSPADGARVQLRMLPVLKRFVEAGRDAGLVAAVWEVRQHALHVVIGPLGISTDQARQTFVDWCRVVGATNGREHIDSYLAQLRLIAHCEADGVQVVVRAEAYLGDPQ